MHPTGKVILLLFFTAIVCFNVYHGLPAKRESFATFPINISIPNLTSVDIYQKNKGIQCDTLYYGSQFLTDSNDLFQARYCLQYKDPSVQEPNYNYEMKFKDYLTKETKVYIQSSPLETFNTEELRKLVRSKLFYFKLSNGDDERPIQGPVFAILTQAPYMLDDQGDVIYHQPFNQDDYSYAPAFAVARSTDTPPKSGLRLYVHLVYLMYDTNRTVVNTEAPGFDFATYFNKKMKAIQKLKVDNRLCGIRCAGDGNRGLICGCVNQTAPYVSHCLGTTDGIPAALQNNSQWTDYMMLYRIQENASQVTDLFSATYFEDVKV